MEVPNIFVAVLVAAVTALSVALFMLRPLHPLFKRILPYVGAGEPRTHDSCTVGFCCVMTVPQAASECWILSCVLCGPLCTQVSHGCPLLSALCLSGAFILTLVLMRLRTYSTRPDVCCWAFSYDC